MQLSVDFKRSLLRTLYDECSDTAFTFLQSIQALRKARVKQSKTGSVITSTVANGHAVTLDVARCNPQDIAAVASSFEDIYDIAKTVLEDGGNATPTDEELLVQILLDPSLKAVRSYRTDFSQYERSYGW